MTTAASAETWKVPGCSGGRPRSGRTWLTASGSAIAKKISMSSGMPRKNSTTAPAGMRIHAWSESRAIPNTRPNTRASTAAHSAAVSVFSRPGMT